MVCGGLCLLDLVFVVANGGFGDLGWQFLLGDLAGCVGGLRGLLYCGVSRFWLPGDVDFLCVAAMRILTVLGLVRLVLDLMV